MKYPGTGLCAFEKFVRPNIFDVGTFITTSVSVHHIVSGIDDATRLIVAPNDVDTFVELNRSAMYRSRKMSDIV